MKNHIICLSFILAAFISYSQIGFGVGYESSGKSEYNTAIKFNIESLKINNITYNGFIIGLDFGINFLENDRTGEAGLVNNPQESTRFLYTILTPGFKLGYQFSNKLYITGAAGLNLVQEHQEFNSSSTGVYSVESDYTNSSLYFRAGINYVSGGAVINPGLGYGSNGFYVSNTFYSGSKKIEDGIKNRKFNREKYQLAGNFVNDLKFKDWEGFVKVFLDDCEEKGIEVNRDNIIAENRKDLAENIIVKSEGINNDGKIEIYFNKKLWKKSNMDKKLYMLYNQLGRDVLNLDYDQGGKMTFRLNKDDSYTWDQFLEDRETMFEMYDNILINEEESKRKKSRIIQN